MAAEHLQDIDIIIVDAFSLLFRAFHSFPMSLTSPDGRLTNAVFGFTRLLLDVLKKVDPEYLVVGTDMGKPTFRHVEYTQYKANREEAPHELTAQIDLMYSVLDSLNIPTIGIEGYEADDVIGTLATRLSVEQPEKNVAIFTGDRDAFQLIHDNVYVLSPARSPKEEMQIVDRSAVVERLGVFPEQVVDYKALCGDASDNIPGVRGVGPKTAVMLISKFGTLERVYAALTPPVVGETETAEQLELHELAKTLSPGLVKKLAESVNEAWLSQKLARIDVHVPLEFSLDQAKLCDYDKGKTLQLFDQLGFSSLKKHLPKDAYEDEVARTVQASLFG